MVLIDQLICTLTYADEKKLGIIIITIIIVILIKSGVSPEQSNPPQPQKEAFTIVSTNPDPLDEATILPNQAIELRFSKPLFKSELKHSFGPDVEHGIEVIGGRDKEFGSKMRFVFKKPLNLGEGFTLFVYSNTKTEEEELGREYIYHFKTIKYTGI